MSDLEMPTDLLIELRVDAEIARGAALPRWGWPVPGPFNGSTGVERIAGWQKIILAERLRLLPEREACTVCRCEAATQRHSEVYFRPLIFMDVCRSCHARVHRRFAAPARWQAFLRMRSLHTTHGDLASSLRITELSRREARQVATATDIFAAIAAL